MTDVGKRCGKCRTSVGVVASDVTFCGEHGGASLVLVMDGDERFRVYADQGRGLRRCRRCICRLTNESALLATCVDHGGVVVEFVVACEGAYGGLGDKPCLWDWRVFVLNASAAQAATWLGSSFRQRLRSLIDWQGRDGWVGLGYVLRHPVQSTAYLAGWSE